MKLNYLKKPLLKRLKIAQAMWKSLKEFCARTYVHAYWYLVEKNRPKAETVMWIIIHFIMTIAAIYIVMFAWSRFTDNPTITTLDSQHYSIFNLDFPAVGICANNKISRTSSEMYADILLTKALPTNYRSKDKLVNYIRYMGRLYDSEIEGIDQFAKFQEILDMVDSNRTTGVFNSLEKLEFLAPKCSDIVKKCKWGGAYINCPDIIDSRRTSEGFCCTFNYVREAQKFVTMKKARLPAGIGPDMGLTILLNLSRNDYFYPLKNFIGITTLIFDPQEYADGATGGVREVPVEPNQEVRITLSINTKIAVDEVQRYSIAKRGCMFATDMPEEYNGNYKFGDCLIKCKLRSVIALCRCVPFNSPTNFPDVDLLGLPYCTLANIQCLNKYKVKWQTYKPREMIKGLEREMEDSLNCDNCYPLCTTSTYISDSTSAKLNWFYENKGSVM